MDAQVSPFQVRGRFFIDFGCHFGGPGASFSLKDVALDGAISIHSFKVILGLGLNGFVVAWKPQNLKNHEIHGTVVQNRGSTKEHQKCDPDGWFPGLVFE